MNQNWVGTRQKEKNIRVGVEEQVVVSDVDGGEAVIKMKDVTQIGKVAGKKEVCECRSVEK